MVGVGKVEISDEQRKRIIEKACVFAIEAGRRYFACAPGTFEGICRAFREEGIELMPVEVEEVIHMGMMGLHGGTAASGIGTCGAVSAACFLIAYVVGLSRKEVAENSAVGAAASLPGIIYVVDRFEEEFGAIDCLRIRYNRTQRAFDFLDPDARFWEMMFIVAERNKCGVLSERDPREIDHPVVLAAKWGAEAICDLLQMDPEERKTPPPELAKRPDPIEIERKIAPILREMGYPNQKISYRHRRAERLGRYRREI